ncbi:MAG: prepilin-type N-terminal cleavage/methylation domain-containing protein [Acidobacteria bacterium]|nr:prepilin-type N-terminal cleavage/methylation domain-containing protein [Acidobacteriota bacterium]MBV9146325.1 prepilin-type N-terminal cleavage/methylation domain-containing protein [Acidobacteriota bacterium]MBV9438214.1 prepilin-type N-terminal cleavage/methylation domain-containing protein [Acidobacteriota bacterium]
MVKRSQLARLGRSSRKGFTLIELMIVISIILILVSIAVPMYQASVIRAKEAVLRQDLKTMRDQIDNYTMDKEKAPQSLQDLVDGGYLRSIPKDPFTGSADTWQVENSDTMASLDQTEPGISDVHSGSNLTGSDGNAYSSW